MKALGIIQVLIAGVYVLAIALAMYHADTETKTELLDFSVAKYSATC